MNKKKLLIFGLPILAIGLVAAVLTYYAMFSVTLNVNQPIEITGNLVQSIDCELGFGAGTTVCDGEEIIVSNDGTSVGTVLITGSTLEEGIEVKYLSELVLTQKTVNFDLDVWEIPAGAEEVEIEYTLMGDEFTAEVTANEKAGYVLVYYSDNIDRFVNPNVAIKVEDVDVEENLPYTDDANAEGGMYDYCDTGEYLTCHGAKIWYVPESALTDNDDGTWSINWGQAIEFYFETELIQYNAEGNIIVYPGSRVSFTPEYTVDNYLDDEVSYSQDITIA